MSAINRHVADEPSYGGGNFPSRQPSSYAPLFGVHRIFLTTALLALAFFVAGLLLDLFLIHVRFVPQIGAAVVLDAVFAGIVAVLVYILLVRERDRRNKVVQRLQMIDEMNHHIRNALQVISFNTDSETDDVQMEELKRAMDRIQWALREILPKVEPEFSSFEGSAREQKRFDPGSSDD